MKKIILLLTMSSSTFIYFGLKYLPNILVKTITDELYSSIDNRMDDLKETIKKQ